MTRKVLDIVLFLWFVSHALSREERIGVFGAELADAVLWGPL